MIPDYKSIYADIINKKYPEKVNDCNYLLLKANLSAIDIVDLNDKIFGTNKETSILNQKLRSYSPSDIFEILHYQKINNLNNLQLANHFKISRNTIAKWKKKVVS